VDFGQAPEDAVTAPRFATYHHQDSFDPDPDRQRAFVKAGSLLLSDRVAADVRAELERRGHQVEVRSTPIAAPVMLHVDRSSGVLRAAGDPAAGRHAAGVGER
jgi:gamma-glutamyltranspeptidase